MSEIFELEYRGLNILDEISTVEIAIDELNKIIHIYDTNQVVEPEYNFSTKQFQMSDGFLKMSKVLYDKKFFNTQSDTVEHWINQTTWIFYGSRKSIIMYVEENIIEISKDKPTIENQIPRDCLHTKYVLRILK